MKKLQVYSDLQYDTENGGYPPTQNREIRSDRTSYMD